jgi:hypothetical protein
MPRPVTCALTSYVEYERCRDELQGVDLTDPWNLLRGTESLFRLVLSDICQEWPTVRVLPRFLLTA